VWIAADTSISDDATSSALSSRLAGASSTARVIINAPDVMNERHI
jgi:hypothetical protein